MGVKITAGMVVGAVHRIDAEEVTRAMRNMTNQRANWPFGVVLKSSRLIGTLSEFFDWDFRSCLGVSNQRNGC